MSDRLLVLFPFLALIIGVVLEGVLAGILTRRGKGWLAFFSGLTSLAGVIAAWRAIVAGRVVNVSFGLWDGPVQLAYHIDGLSVLFALMGAGIGTAVLLYAVTYMDGEKGTTRFFSLILIFIAGLINLVYTADLFVFYLNWEVVGLCSFLLVGFWYNQPEAAYGARKVFTITHLAGYGLQRFQSDAVGHASIGVSDRLVAHQLLACLWHPTCRIGSRFRVVHSIAV